MKSRKDKIVEAYYDFQVDTGVMFGANQSYAEAEVEKVLNFEIELAKV